LGGGTEHTSLVFGMLNHIFPADKRGRTLFTFSLFFAGYLYLLRVVDTDFFVGMLGTLLRAFFFLSPIFWFVGLIFHIILVSIYVFKSHGHLSPGLFLVGGLLFARFLPIPPSPEEISFSWQRAEYEQIVELARHNQLQQGNHCLAQNQFLPPSSYYQSSSECILVNQQDGVVVEFAPRSLERPIVFLENPTSDTFPPCWSDNDSRVFKQLGEHWFICKRWLMEEP
jgi:hypothetical protein